MWKRDIQMNVVVPSSSLLLLYIMTLSAGALGSGQITVTRNNGGKKTHIIDTLRKSGLDESENLREGALKGSRISRVQTRGID